MKIFVGEVSFEDDGRPVETFTEFSSYEEAISKAFEIGRFFTGLTIRK